MSRVPFPFNATGAYANANVHLPMGVHEDAHKDGKVIQTPTSAYFLLNSMDRFQNASLNANTLLVSQAWNDFRLQKPAALMDAFAKRINVCEINFPWAIPNITVQNNKFGIQKEIEPSMNQIVIEAGFYTPEELVEAINTALALVYPEDAPILAYDSANFRYTITCTDAFKLFPQLNTIMSARDYYTTTPSLLHTLGFSFDQLQVQFNLAIRGLTTQSLYTDYIDIVSDKLTTYANYRDGTSANGGKNSVLIRLYLADESSATMTAPIGTRPFTIHRQFVNPKSIEWDSAAFIDWIDIQVYDQYGQLVALPQYAVSGVTPFYGPLQGAYPDFQITCLASES